MPQWPDIQKWENHETAENRIQARSLSKENKISSILARLLIVRNLTSKQLIWNFLEPHFKHCHDPFMMRDMDHAVQRLRVHFERRNPELGSGPATRPIGSVGSLASGRSGRHSIRARLWKWLPDRVDLLRERRSRQTIRGRASVVLRGRSKHRVGLSPNRRGGGIQAGRISVSHLHRCTGPELQMDEARVESSDVV